MDFFPFIVEHFTKTEVFTIVSTIYIIIYYLSTVCIWNAAECLTHRCVAQVTISCVWIVFLVCTKLPSASSGVS